MKTNKENIIIKLHQTTRYQHGFRPNEDYAVVDVILNIPF